MQKTDETEGIVMTLRGKTEPALDQDTAFVRKTLGLDPNAQEFRVVYGSVAKDDKEIAILSRSMLEIIVDLASYIDVPPEHVKDKRVNPTMPPESFDGKEIPPLIRIHSSEKKPPDSFVAVNYRNTWFWIDDRDLRSNTLFPFTMFIFSLTETEGKEGARPPRIESIS